MRTAHSSLYRGGISLAETLRWTETPPPPKEHGTVHRDPPSRGQNDWHMPVKILPCPKLRLRAVNISQTTNFIHWISLPPIKLCTLFYKNIYHQSFLPQIMVVRLSVSETNFTPAASQFVPDLQGIYFPESSAISSVEYAYSVQYN